MVIITMQPKHYIQVANIYLQGIATGMATFQSVAPSWQAWDAAHIPTCRLVAIEQDTVIGWAALTPVSNRPVYKGVAEVSIYIAANKRCNGIGKQLLQALVTTSEANGFWTLQSSIFSENQASIQLHQRCGFREIGYREKIGCINGTWKDNVLMERRSKLVDIKFTKKYKS